MIRRYTITQSKHNLIMTECHELIQFGRGKPRWDYVCSTNDDFHAIPHNTVKKLIARDQRPVNFPKPGKKYIYTVCEY